MLHEVDTQVVAAIAAAHNTPSLPWFFQPASLFACSLPTRAYTLEDNAFVVATERGDEMNLRAVFVRPELRRRGLGRSLMAQLRATHAASVWRVAPFVLEGGAADLFFRGIGFQPAGNQFELSLDLAGEVAREYQPDGNTLPTA
jgi:GNAT superfamily N-acetyltransferase